MAGMSSADGIVDESPASPTMVEVIVPKSEIAAIPVYSISDSDEDRANAFMRNMSEDLRQIQNAQQSAAPNDEYNPDEPEIMEANQAAVVDISGLEKGPSIQVMFMNTDIGRKYRHDIEEFFHTLMTAENLNKNPEPLPRIQRRPNLNLTQEEQETGTIQETTLIGSISVFRTYMLDRQGWPMIANMLNQTPGISIPDYTQVYGETYPPPPDAKILENRPIKTSKKCFNCGGDSHEANKCPKPFDKRTFNKNRAQFLATGLQYGRYHREDKNKNSKAGVLSDSLRRALGLEDDELPLHIYRMRDMGYPPGWLLHAESTNSGLAMFDKTGNEVDLDGDRMEDGQVPEHRIRDEANLKYNSDALISFPGFNVPCPEGVNDKALNRRGYPAMKEENMLQTMSSRINIVEENTAESTSNKRPRYDSSSDPSYKRFKSSQQADMDLSDEEGDNSAGIEIVEMPPPLPPDDDEDDDLQGYHVIDELPPEPASPGGQDQVPQSVPDINDTLNALEAQKQKLLAELEDMEEGSMTSSTPATQSNSQAMSYDISGSEAPPVFDIDGGDNNGEGDNNESTQASYQSLSYLVCTPVIQHSGIDKLPSYSKFSDGITEHLPFENLPSSTGVYAKMSGIMKDVKEKMAVLRPKRRSKK